MPLELPLDSVWSQLRRQGPYRPKLKAARPEPGRFSIVHYWATWCAPCRVEMPILDAYYRRHHSQGLAMIGASIDQGASKRKLQEATSRYSFAVASVDDVRMPRRDIPVGIPVNRVYDRSRRLVFTEGGDGRSTIDMATLERVVTPLLAKH